MKDHNEDTYFKVKDKDGDGYLCPVNSVGDKRKVTEDELEDCIEEDVIGRYSGNIKIKK